MTQSYTVILFELRANRREVFAPAFGRFQSIREARTMATLRLALGCPRAYPVGWTIVDADGRAIESWVP
jgi:hypothetical protein